MSNVLLVEPRYRSRFPPLGLMRISTHHKRKGDCVSFARGCDKALRAVPWHRVYVASLYTWELPRTVRTIKYYSTAAIDPGNIFVGGIAATLLPAYLRREVSCRIIEGLIDKPNRLGRGTPAIGKLPPDYGLLSQVDYEYSPTDAYFIRATQGCPRGCAFCAVPLLEKEFGPFQPLRQQVERTEEEHGPKQHMVVLDNNVLAAENIDDIVADIRDVGFVRGARLNHRQRRVDFNQGIDARVISRKPRIAQLLSSICLSPVRLANDYAGMTNSYERAVRMLAGQGFATFTTYMLYNFNDSPRDLYDRIQLNCELSDELSIRITGFPMRFVPVNALQRGHVGRNWSWRSLRGMQCVLLATHGLVSPNPGFVRASFGSSFEEFQEIMAMPDRYIIYRDTYRHNGASDWIRAYRRLGKATRTELLSLLEELNRQPGTRQRRIRSLAQPLRNLVEHYYPNGGVAPKTPDEDPALR